MTHNTEGSENSLFYLTFSNTVEFLNFNISNLSLELKCNINKMQCVWCYVTVIIEKVNEKYIHDSLLGLGILMRKGP